MNTGLYLPNFGSWGDPTAMVSLATDAEAGGWDGFFIWNHIGGFKNQPELINGSVAEPYFPEKVQRSHRLYGVDRFLRVQGRTDVTVARSD